MSIFESRIGKNSALVVAALAVAVQIMSVGCSTAQLPDPNDLATAAPQDRAKLIHGKIKDLSDVLDQQVEGGHLSDTDRLQMLSDKAKELLKIGDPAHSAPADAWIYADLYITTGQYKEAIPLLKSAVQYASSVKDDDRRVNDSLRLARCLAETGHPKDALDLAQSVIDSKPVDPNPVLPSVLLELTPIVQGKGFDPQLVHLLREAIDENLKVKVDPKSVPGAMFLIARPHHVGKAWDKIIELLNKEGKTQDAIQASADSKVMLDQLRKESRAVLAAHQ